jgi:hypothetical protein
MTWRHLQSDNIEFTIKRLRDPIGADIRPDWQSRPFRRGGVAGATPDGVD